MLTMMRVFQSSLDRNLMMVRIEMLAALVELLGDLKKDTVLRAVVMLQNKHVPMVNLVDNRDIELILCAEANEGTPQGAIHLISELPLVLDLVDLTEQVRSFEAFDMKATVRNMEAGVYVEAGGGSLFK